MEMWAKYLGWKEKMLLEEPFMGYAIWLSRCLRLVSKQGCILFIKVNQVLSKLPPFRLVLYQVQMRRRFSNYKCTYSPQDRRACPAPQNLRNLPR